MKKISPVWMLSVILTVLIIIFCNYCRAEAEESSAGITIEKDSPADWGSPAANDMFGDYFYLAHPNSAYYSTSAVIDNLFGYNSLEPLLAVCGTNPQGKLLICILSEPIVGDKNSKELFDFRAMKMLPKQFYPRDPGEVEYLITVHYKYENAGWYYDGSQALRNNAVITLRHLPSMQILYTKVVKGGNPQEKVSSGSKAHAGTSPSYHDIAKQYAYCLARARATGRVSGDYGYILRDGKAAIIYYAGTDTNLAIPAELDGYTVNAIESEVFYGLQSVESITFPPAVERIGTSAFTGCTSVKTIQFPAELKEVGKEAFSALFRLQELNLPPNLLSIGETAFRSIWTLKSIRLPEGLKVIKNGAFQSCDNLGEVYIPESVTELEGDIFEKKDPSTLTVRCSTSSVAYKLVEKYKYKWATP